MFLLNAAFAMAILDKWTQIYEVIKNVFTVWEISKIAEQYTFWKKQFSRYKETENEQKSLVLHEIIYCCNCYNIRI